MEAGTLLRKLRRLAARVLPPQEVAVAIAPDRLVALTVRRQPGGPVPRRILRRNLSTGPDGRSWPELREALVELREKLPDASRAPRTHIALLPPLARTKGVSLPSSSRSLLRRLVTREASRHFLRAPDEPVADAVPLESRGEGSHPALAACAERDVAETVLGAAAGAGFDAGLLVPGSYAAAEGALELAAGRDDGVWTLELRGDDWSRDLRLKDGGLRAVSHAAHDDGRADPREGAGGGGDGSSSDVAGGSATVRVEAERSELPGLDEIGPAGLAAFGALVQPEDGLHLLPGEARNRWTRRLRTRAAALAATAAALLVVAAGVHLWGLDRELAAVARARDALAHPVSRAVTAREAAERMGAILSSLRERRSDRPEWTAVVAELARVLPSSAYVDRLSVTERELLLTGSARSPSSLVSRLENSSYFAGAGLESVTQSSDGAADAFRILVRLPGDGDPGPTASGNGP